MLNQRIAEHPITIQNPNGERMHSTHIGELDLPMLRIDARKAHIVPALQNCSLLSMGTLCDAGYNIALSKTEINVLDTHNNNAIVLSGARHRATGMWHIDLPSPKIEFVNRLGEPKLGELVAFAHSTLFSPALSTLEFALNKGFLTNFPALTTKNLSRYPPVSRPMDKGHLDQTRKN